jgi:hypothetical protein|tara:strand:+ start:23566 stop:25668 length:2103 start_codon:yes stop_codon:yes gene_type:complete
MAETIDFEVKSNISKATADTKDFAAQMVAASAAVDNVNEQISIQGDVVNDLEKDLVKMEQQLSETPKTAKAGYFALEKAIESTTTELKLEKIATKELNQDRREAVADLKELEDATKDAGAAAADGKKGFTLLGTGVKAVGTAFKALGIGAIVAIFAALKAAVERNQKAMDLINTVVTTVSTTFNQIVDVLIDTVEWVTASSDRFDGLTKVLSGVVTIAITPLKLAFFGLKLGIQQLMLAWEDSFLGGGDAGVIKALRADINDTKISLEETAAAAVQAGGDIVANIGDAINEITAIGSMAIDGLSQINVAANFAMAESATAAANSSKLAAAELQGLIEQYDREAELQRQIRDDVRLGMDERIAANTELGRILEEQSGKMLEQANIRIASAEIELSQNRDNIDLQVALTEAINERAAIEATITGLKSEQLVNLAALQEEQDAIDAEKYAKTVEEEQYLHDLVTQNMLDSITNLQEKALAELEIQKAKDIAEVSQFENKEKIIAAINAKYDKKEQALIKKADAAKKKMDELSMKGKLDLAKGTFDNIAAIVGKESKAGKAAAAASATVSALQGATSAFASLAPIPFVGPVLGGIAAAAALVSGFANVKAIYATKTPDGGGGGGGSSGGGGGGGASAGAAPDIQEAAASAADAGDIGDIAPQMVGGAFELGGGDEPEAAKAYVVTDDMTDSQEQLAGIRRRASV